MDELMMNLQEGSQELRERGSVCMWEKFTQIHTQTQRDKHSVRGGGEAPRVRKPEITSMKQSVHEKEVEIDSVPAVSDLQRQVCISTSLG